MNPKAKIQLSKILKSPADAADPVAGALAVIVHVAIEEGHGPRVVVAVLSGRPVVVRLGGSPDGLK